MKLLMIAMLFSLSGCLGYSSISSEVTGQPKRIQFLNNLLCPDFTTVDLSLGVMRNGVGSMSTEDDWFLIENNDLVAVLKTASENGSLVKITYDTRRFTFCVPERVVRTVTVLH